MLDTFARYSLKVKAVLVALNDLKYEDTDESYIDLFIKLYCSVFIQNVDLDLLI